MDSLDKMDKKEKKKLGALDVVIILIVLVCALSVGFRIFSDYSSNVGEGVQLDNYSVTFKVMGIRDSSARNFIKKGEKFYFTDSKTYFGEINDGSITITDAMKYYEALDGTIVTATNTGTGDLYKVDVEASLDVKGKVDADGRFLVDGNKFLGENQEVQIHSKYLAITVLILSINKSS